MTAAVPAALPPGHLQAKLRAETKPLCDATTHRRGKLLVPARHRLRRVASVAV